MFTANEKGNHDEMTRAFVGCFTGLDVFEQRLSPKLYRLIAQRQLLPRCPARYGLTIEKTACRSFPRQGGLFSDKFRVGKL